MWEDGVFQSKEKEIESRFELKVPCLRDILEFNGRKSWTGKENEISRAKLSLHNGMTSMESSKSKSYINTMAENPFTSF
jgi:hypothetical protein